MRRYAGSRDAALTRRRIVAGAATALAVTFTFVAANAIWYQPHAHKSPILATRNVQPVQAPVPSAPRPESPAVAGRTGSQPGDDAARDVTTIIRLENERPAPAGGDALVAEIQSVMADLGLYQGEVDGIAGPMTREAIEAYQKTIGLEATGRVDDTLLAKLGIAGEPAVPAPPSSRPRGDETDAMQTASLDSAGGDAMVMRIQAGLKAFGNDGIEVDGVTGPRTRAAIREFQSLFGLPVTGEPDEELYVKMREIGLAN